ncbi:peptidylprolyl isomerase [Thermosphaera sp.]
MKRLGKGVAAGMFAAIMVVGGANGQAVSEPFRSPREILSGTSAQETASNPERVVAKVNGVPILWKDVAREVDRAIAQIANRVPPQEMDAARAQVTRSVLDGLITRQLLIQAAAERQLSATPEEVAQVRQALEQQIPPGQSLEGVLTAQGVTPAELEENIRRDIVVTKLIAEIVNPVTPPADEQVQQFYQQHEAQMMAPDRVRARHILVRIGNEDSAEVRRQKRAKAEEIRKKLLEGADFAAMVKEHSDDAASVARGGEYVFGRGQMVPPFEEAAFSQDINAIGSVVETAFGYHIIQVLDRQLARKQSLEEATPAIRQFLLNQEQQRRVQEFIAQRREASKIEVFDQP